MLLSLIVGAAVGGALFFLLSLLLRQRSASRQVQNPDGWPDDGVKRRATMRRGPKRKSAADSKGKRNNEGQAFAGYVPKKCPVCGHELLKGQLVKASVFPAKPANRSGSILEGPTHVFGCPFCYPSRADNPRVCPVCSKIIPEEGYLICRMFDNKESGKKHVRVLGCTHCRNKTG